VSKQITWKSTKIWLEKAFILIAGKISFRKLLEEPVIVLLIVESWHLFVEMISVIGKDLVQCNQ